MKVCAEHPLRTHRDPTLPHCMPYSQDVWDVSLTWVYLAFSEAHPFHHIPFVFLSHDTSFSSHFIFSYCVSWITQPFLHDRAVSVRFYPPESHRDSQGHPNYLIPGMFYSLGFIPLLRVSTSLSCNIPSIISLSHFFFTTRSFLESPTIFTWPGDLRLSQRDFTLQSLKHCCLRKIWKDCEPGKPPLPTAPLHAYNSSASLQ